MMAFFAAVRDRQVAELAMGESSARHATTAFRNATARYCIRWRKVVVESCCLPAVIVLHPRTHGMSAALR